MCRFRHPTRESNVCFYYAICFSCSEFWKRGNWRRVVMLDACGPHKLLLELSELSADLVCGPKFLCGGCCPPLLLCCLPHGCIIVIHLLYKLDPCSCCCYCHAHSCCAIPVPRLCSIDWSDGLFYETKVSHTRQNTLPTARSVGDSVQAQLT